MLRELVIMDLMVNKIAGTIPGKLSLIPNLLVLNLGKNQLSGSIPPSLGNISSLTNLNLGTNTLSGPIPNELSRLRSLKLLDLSINNLTGEIPPSIYNMSALMYLVVASNRLWGELPYDVGVRLPNLLAFNFCINEFTGRIPGSLHNLTNIGLIRMAHNLLHGSIPPGLGKLTSLKMYNIGYNRIVSSGDNWLDFVTSLANNTQLNFLSFEGNLIQGTIPQSIGNWSKVLSNLYMGENFLHGEIPRSIGQLSGLALLNMSYNELTGSIPIEITQLKGLQVLNLARNNLSGGVPKSISDLEKLNQLDLSGNKLNGTVPKEVLRFPSFSNILNLSHNLFSGQLPEEMGLSAVAIDISNNQLSGNIPSSIMNCESLETLNAARNSFSGPIPSSLGNLTNLQTLDLSSNQFSGTIPQSLESLSAVQSMNLSFNDLQGGIPCGGVFKNLSRIDLQGNPRLSLDTTCQLARGDHTRRRIRPYAIVIVIMATLFVCLAMISSLYMITRKRRANRLSKTSDLMMGRHEMVKYDELRQATADFSEGNLIGKGSFGKVFKGLLRDNIMVAIKVLDIQMGASWKSFVAECEALKNVRHRNLVKLITCCSSLDCKNMEFLALVYEFLSNGSLEDWIKGKRRKENGDGLSFADRLNVAIDVANALDYLHHDTETPVVHCDLKPSNVLLDEDMTAKIGDFGLARLLMEQEPMGDQPSMSSTHVLKGSIGYMPPGQCSFYLHKRKSKDYDSFIYLDLYRVFTNKRTRLAQTSRETYSKRFQEKKENILLRLGNSLMNLHIGAEYGLGARPSTAGDTYSFGVTLLELFTGKSPSHEGFTGDQTLVSWVEASFPAQLTQVLLDPELLELPQHRHDHPPPPRLGPLGQAVITPENLMNSSMEIFEIGLSCTVTQPDRRITIRNALHKLKDVRNKLCKS